VRRKPTGVCSLRVLHQPSADFTEGDLANPSRQRAGIWKTGGLELKAFHQRGGEKL